MLYMWSSSGRSAVKWPLYERTLQHRRHQIMSRWNYVIALVGHRVSCTCLVFTGTLVISVSPEYQELAYACVT